MYTVVDIPDGKTSRRGRGKTQERLAIENLPVGKAIYIPKGNAPYGSMAAWSHKVGKDRGLLISVYSVGSDWLVSANFRTTP